MPEDYILIYDSGNGGQYVLQIFKKLMPNENYLLFKDIKHCPYGNKTKRELESIFFSNIAKLNNKYNIKVIVIACNTMSSMFGERLKRHKNLPKVFLVLPIINKTILQSKTLLLATENTCKYNLSIIKNNINKNLYILPLPSFAKEIDDNLSNALKLKERVNAILEPYKTCHIKNVILGCTHYNYIKKHIEDSLGEVQFWEKSEIVAKEVSQYLRKYDLSSSAKKFIELYEI